MKFFDKFKQKSDPEQKSLTIEEYRDSLEYPLEPNLLLDRMMEIKKNKQQSDRSKIDKIWLDKHPGEIPPEFRKKKTSKPKSKRKSIKKCKCK